MLYVSSCCGLLKGTWSMAGVSGSDKDACVFSNK